MGTLLVHVNELRDLLPWLMVRPRGRRGRGAALTPSWMDGETGESFV